eukprot:Skav236708  [mRNA]  locus=scaffold738:335439:337857:- [translate_table: standard]
MVVERYHGGGRLTWSWDVTMVVERYHGGGRLTWSWDVTMVVERYHGGGRLTWSWDVTMVVERYHGGGTLPWWWNVNAVSSETEQRVEVMQRQRDEERAVPREISHSAFFTTNFRRSAVKGSYSENESVTETPSSEHLFHFGKAFPIAQKLPDRFSDARLLAADQHQV